MRRLGVVTGLRVELEIFARALGDAPGPILHCHGIGAGAAHTAALASLADGAEALLSFGSGGGLDPSLTPGTVVLASGVAGPDGATLPVDPVWAARLGALAGGEAGWVSAPIVSAPFPVRLPANKAAMFRATGAAAVDLESYSIAAVAAEAGVPFLALRAVLDPAGRAVPSAALAAVSKNGRMDWPALALAIASRPWEVAALVRLAADAAAARRALSGFVRRALPGFGL